MSTQRDRLLSELVSSVIIRCNLATAANVEKLNFCCCFFFSKFQPQNAFYLTFHPYLNGSSAHALDRQLSLLHCPNAKQPDSTKSNGWELSSLSLIPGCKHLTGPVSTGLIQLLLNLPLWMSDVGVCGCALFHTNVMGLSCLHCRPEHGPVALIIPLAAHNESLAGCRIHGAMLVIRVMRTVALFDALI